MTKNNQSILHRLLFCGFILIYLFVFPGFAVARQLEPEKVILQLKWLHQFQFAGYYAAIEKEYYKDAGLDVILKEGRPGVSYTDEVISGNANYGIDMPSLLLERQKGKTIVVLAVIFQHSPEILIARKDSGITSIHDLIGKKIMLRPQGNIEARAMFYNEGIPAEKLNIIDHSWNINDIKERKVDASAGYITDRPFLMQEQGIPYTIIRPMTYGVDFYGDCLFTTEAEIKKHPERVKAFFEASLKGWDYAMKNPEEIIYLIRQKYSIRRSKNALLFEAKAMQELIQPKFIEIGHMNPGRWKHIADTFVKLKMLDPKYSLEGFLYNPNPQPDYTNVMRMVWILFSVIPIITIFVLVLFIFNRKLKMQVAERTKHLLAEITEREKIEKKLAAEKECLTVTLRSIGDGVITTDIKGKVQLINKATEEVIGWSQAEAAGRLLPEIFNIINEKTGEPCKNSVDNVLFSGQNVGFANHTVLIAKDGTEKSITYSRALINDKKSKIIGVVLVFRDITKQLRMEYELLKAKKLESLGVLAGGIAHDFNNILFAILGNIELAEISLDAGCEAYPLLQDAKKASLRAKALTQQLLTFSKGGDPVKKTSSIWKTITESTNFVLHGSPVSCQFSIPDDLWLVDIDSGQISQVIQNLIINAKYAMPGGGEIRITCINISDIRSETSLNLSGKAYIKITVQDNGYGITKKYLDKIFDPYFTTKQEGSGLGLAITHSIIRKHYGHITVQSTMGKGTTFTVYLPASEKQIDHFSTEKIKKLESIKAKILVMDDDQFVQGIVKLMLGRLGHEVLQAKDGKKAIEIFNENHKIKKSIDIIIMDLTIPGGIGGKDAIQEILKIDPAAKVIVSSGYSNDPIMSNYQQYGFEAAIAKPFMLADLNKTINTILKQAINP